VLELGCATVPTFTVIARKGYGGGYVVMSGGRTFQPELVLAWPSAQTAVMAVESAVELVYKRAIDADDSPDDRRQELVARFQAQLGAVRGAEGFGVDAVCRPSETRAWLSSTLGQLPRRRLMQTLTPRRHAVQPL
jgi:propionyl-CoA carboxylase beta chain